MSGAGPSQDVRASRATPRREARGCERGRRPTLTGRESRRGLNEAARNCSSPWGSAAAEAASVGVLRP